MASIPLPALHVEAPQPPDTLGQVGKVMQLKSLMQGQQLQQENLQGAQMENQLRAQQLKDQQAMTAAMQEWDGKDLNSLPSLMVKRGASAQAVIGLKGHILDQQQKYSTIAKDDAETGAKNIDTLTKKHDMVLGALNAVTDGPDEGLGQRLTATAQDLVKQGLLPPEHLQAAQQMAQLDPQSMRQQLSVYEKGLTGQKAQLEKAKDDADLQLKNAELLGKQAEAEQKQRANYASQLAMSKDQADYDKRLGELPYRIAKQFPPQFDRDTVLQAGMTPHEVAALPVEKMEMKDWLAKNPGKGPADYARYIKTLPINTRYSLENGGGAGGPGGAPGGGATGPAAGAKFGMTPEAFDQASEKYYQTGQLPPLGRGISGVALNRALMNRAGELHPGASLAENAAAYKANEKSLEGLQKNRDAVVSFENTAKKNLQLFVEQAQKVVDTGSPLINKPVRMISEMMGGTDFPAYKAAQTVANNEIAKVTSNPGLSGVLTDEARREIANFNPQSATLKQSVRVANLLLRDMANRHQSFDEQLADIRQRMRTKPGTGQGNNQPQTNSNDPNDPFARFGGSVHP